MQERDVAGVSAGTQLTSDVVCTGGSIGVARTAALLPATSGHHVTHQPTV